jgi:hypothetical protein
LFKRRFGAAEVAALEVSVVHEHQSEGGSGGSALGAGGGGLGVADRVGAAVHRNLLEVLVVIVVAWVASLVVCVVLTRQPETPIYATQELQDVGDALVADLRRIEAASGELPESVQDWRSESLLARVVFDNEAMIISYERRGAGFYILIGQPPNGYPKVFIEDSTKSEEWFTDS